MSIDVCKILQLVEVSVFILSASLIIGSPSGEPMFSLCRKWRNLPDIAKSGDASMGKKQNSFLFRTASCHFSVEVFPQITNNLSAGNHCQRDIKEAPLYECHRISV